MNDPHNNQPPGKRIGQGMWMLFWCLLLAALVFYFSAREEEQYYPNQHIANAPESVNRTITLQANRAGHYTLSGRINGEIVTFLIDTGATEVVVPGDIADELGLPQGRRQAVNTANGTIDVYRTRIDSLELGPIHLRDIPASINPYMDGDILLGMSALSSLELTQRNNQLVLRQP